jgi:hypothetical protein
MLLRTKTTSAMGEDGHLTDGAARVCDSCQKLGGGRHSRAGQGASQLQLVTHRGSNRNMITLPPSASRLLHNHLDAHTMPTTPQQQQQPARQVPRAGSRPP